MGSWVTIHTFRMAVTTPITDKLADMYGCKKNLLLRLFYLV